ncbi:NUDIX domain-containing protein [Pseudomonas sp. 10C3]|uniref:NUDIX hydrolase n=1 Tax=Pseudomonas sp. 10C3 TaxID=3118753 RepID=UPI002E80E72C|nr:NUDIX domain-containing protein [Pseudomonas sp. 10C3]MEE3508525.1 NUDIX domain-containing protein [Pseudomonas sp. 10C3]
MSLSIAKAGAYGGVLLTHTGQILLREPSNHFDGYVWTFAKGKAELGDSPEQTALREVREETGYEGEVIDVLPGVFKGGTSTNAYFVMRHIGSQGPLDWETWSTRWVSFEEAQRLIEQTTNSIGRMRDLAVLVAAKVWFDANRREVLPNTDTCKPATKNDWNSQEMPARYSTLALEFTLNTEDAIAIRLGFIPSKMEEKWFAYFADNTLYQHRSWTGYCIDQIHFVTYAGGLRATHAEVNRDPEQYESTDDAEDLRRIEMMVRGLAELNQMPPQPSSVPSAIQLASQPNYLGKPEVVHQLLAGWFEVVLKCIVKEATPADRHELMISLVRIMTEDNTGYVRMPGWHTADQLGKSLVKCLGLDEDYCAGESLAMIVSEGLAAVDLAVRKLSETMFLQVIDEATWQQRHTELLSYVVSVFLGTESVLFPGKILQQMAEPHGKATSKSFDELLAELNGIGKRLPAFKFVDIAVQAGTVLTFKLNAAVQCVVAQGNKVEFQGQVVSLSRAAVLALQQAGRKVKAARGPDFWLYMGISLTDYRTMMQEES